MVTNVSSFILSHTFLGYWLVFEAVAEIVSTAFDPLPVPAGVVLHRFQSFIYVPGLFGPLNKLDHTSTLSRADKAPVSVPPLVDLREGWLCAHGREELLDLRLELF